MYSDYEIDNLIKPLIDRQQAINTYIISKIASKLREIGTLSPVDLKRLKIMFNYGADVREINAEIAKQANMQVREIKGIIKSVAKETYTDAKPFYDYRHKSQISFEKNKNLQRVINSIANRTAGEYRNISNSRATGYMIADPKNPTKLKFCSISDTYKNVIDRAIQEAQSGLVDTETAIRRATKQLLDSGIRRMYWDSGYTQRLDTAVRRNILEGIRAISQGVEDQMGKEFGADGKELSAHPNSAPDHEPFQGHRFTNAEWEKLQTNSDFEDVDGEKFEAVERIIGQWNCYHVARSVILDATKPRYTKAYLQRLIKENHDGYTLPSGKHITMYECTQMQRQLETKIRYAKEEQTVMRTLGDRVGAQLAQAKVNKYTDQYKIFSKDCGLTTKRNRITVPNYTRIK